MWSEYINSLIKMCNSDTGDWLIFKIVAKWLDLKSFRVNLKFDLVGFQVCDKFDKWDIEGSNEYFRDEMLEIVGLMVWLGRILYFYWVCMLKVDCWWDWNLWVLPKLRSKCGIEGGEWDWNGWECWNFNFGWGFDSSEWWRTDAFPSTPIGIVRNVNYPPHVDQKQDQPKNLKSL